MKTIKLSIIFSLFTILVSAQVKQSIETETLTGYEYNYFKSPTEVLQDGVLFDESSLISSSIYQDLNAKYKSQNKINKHELRFNSTFKSRLFYKNIDDSYWSLYGNAKYQYSLRKKTKLFFNAIFHRKNREGLDGAQDVLINPLGYTQYKAITGVSLSPIAGNKTILNANYRFKNYDAFGIRDLQYNEVGAELKTTQTYKADRKTHKFGAKAYYKSRKYKTSNSSDVIPDGERHWDYLMLKGFYQYPISKKFKILPGFSYLNRMDKLDNRSGFKQFGPELKVNYKSQLTKLYGSFKYQTRDYTSIEARNNDELIGNKLTYRYVDFSINADHKLGQSDFLLTAKIFSRVRTTNYTDISARSFRGYRNQYAGIGIKWLVD